MKNLSNAIRLTLTQILKAGLGVFAFVGALPTLQASTKIDLEQIQRIEAIRLRLHENDRLVNEKQGLADAYQAEQSIAGLSDIPDWPDWSDWGNGWRNY